METPPPGLGPAPLYVVLDRCSRPWRSLDGGASFEQIFDQTISILEIDPLVTSTIYAVQSGDQPRIWKSGDGGASWILADAGLEEIRERRRFIRGLAIDAADSSNLYLITDERLYRSLDGGLNWTETGDPDLTFRGAYRGLEVDRESGTVYAIFDHRDLGSTVLRSADRGGTWGRQTIAPRLNSVDHFALISGRPPSLYVANARLGVLRSSDGGVSWRPVVDRETGGGPEAVARIVAFPGSAVAGSDENSEIVYAAGRRGIQRIEILEKSSLALRGGRFTVEVEWRDAGGVRGTGRVGTVAERDGGGEAEALRSQDSTVLQFFSEDNWEMLLKVLDGRTVNDRHWVFLAAATDAGYTVEITDTSCGTVKTYRNALGRAAPAVNDTDAFADCEDPLPPNCTTTDGVICLGEADRFRAEVIWRDALGQRDHARQVVVPEAGFAESNDSGLFFFFSQDNWEFLVKVLDGCAVNGRFWVFGAATTDVEYTLTVTDTATGETAQYFNPQGNAADAINDTAAFSCP